METPTSSQPFRPILRVENMWVRKGGLRGHKWIIKDVSFEVKPGEFVAIIGPNGAGKTKLLEAIVGDRPYAGRVMIHEQDLYAQPEHWLRHLGWVPVYNVLHESLRAEQALEQIARLRLPGVKEDIIRKRIQLLLGQLEFPEHRRRALIRELSSGERKRLDLCAELLTNPPLLLLDEPTTNLDPDAERSLMELLRNRSWGKRQAVVVVTHTLQSLYYCDRVLYLANGRLRAAGPYDQVLEQLEGELGNGEPPPPSSSEPLSLRSLLTTAPDVSRSNGLSRDDASRWADIYRKSRAYEREDLGTPPRKPTPMPASSKIQFRPKNWLNDLWILLKRNWMLFSNNPSALGLYFLLGPFSGLLSRIVLRDNAFIQDDAQFGYSSVFDTTDARQAVFIIALVVTLLGLIGSFLDITKERQIYRYERVKGLSPWAYLLSKWLILAGLVGIMSPSFLMAVLTFQGQFIPSANQVLTTLYLACIAAVTLGLAVSAAASSERTATGLLGIVVVFHLFFSGGVDFNERFRALLDRISVLATSHWAAEGISSSIQLYCWASNPRFQDFNSLGHLISVWLNLGVYIGIALVLAFVALRMQDTWYPLRARLTRALFNEHVWTVIPLIVILASWAFFLKGRSQDYYFLRSDLDNIRVENSTDRDLFQSLTGYVSQSMCPVATPLPPPATPMVALPPTPAAQITQSQPTPGTSLVQTEEGVPTLLEEEVAPLPTGTLLQSTTILFGPEHADLPLETLAQNTPFTLLGKDLAEGWFRIREDGTGRQLIGWVFLESTNLLSSDTGAVASPPRCAAPRAYLEGDELSPSVEWISDVDGHVVIVVDLFRDEAGLKFPPAQLLVGLNGQAIDSYPIQPTRQSFVFRGLAIDVKVVQGDLVRVYFDGAPLIDRLLYLRASVFYVPGGCSF
ncbi:MAG: ATP-binding cassette domain-containing protein [Anaerolineales bacterium]|nr:ATP-binding cassette domain-containing protein [Anaerolineales bacterium]